MNYLKECEGHRMNIKYGRNIVSVLDYITSLFQINHCAMTKESHMHETLQDKLDRLTIELD